MAFSRKGWRSISVGERAYCWRTIGRDWDNLDVIVVTDAAFIRGRAAPQLRFCLRYDNHDAYRADGTTHHRQAAVTPAVVRRAIELSSDNTPPFSGEHGVADPDLSAEFVSELQQLARQELTGARSGSSAKQAKTKEFEPRVGADR